MQFHQDDSGRVSFGDGKEYARVVCDSVGPHGQRLVSVEVRYWRAIHAEFMTHRDRARNAASSRAIPFFRTKDGRVIDNCMYGMIDRDPFFPEFIGAEKPGMQSGAELTGEARAKALEHIDAMRRFCLESAKRMAELGVHKSICNRYLEPWMYITVLYTATEWANFFRLRVHPKAEKHFDKSACLIREAIRRSEPAPLQPGRWHTPYIRPGEHADIAEWVAGAGAGALPPSLDNCETRAAAVELATNMISAGRCARLSYLTHDGVRDFGADIKLFKSLIDPEIEADRDDDVIHASPLEHVAQCHYDFAYRSGPFVGWHQMRKNHPRENVAGVGPLS